MESDSGAAARRTDDPPALMVRLGDQVFRWYRDSEWVELLDPGDKMRLLATLETKFEGAIPFGWNSPERFVLFCRHFQHDAADARIADVNVASASEDREGAAPPLDPRQRFRVAERHTTGGEVRYVLTPIALYGRQPEIGDVLMPAVKAANWVETGPYGPPYFDVRIGTPLQWEWVGSMPEIVSIDLWPPAAGPEIEITFGTAKGAQPMPEQAMREQVKRCTNRSVLAIRQRGA